jgi:hypothetical protein
MSTELGRSVSIHRGRFAAGLMMWYAGGVCALGSAIRLFQGLTGQAAPEDNAFSALGLVISSFFVAWAYMRWKQVLEVFERGFVWKRLLGTHTVKLDQIKQVSHITHTSRRGTYVEVAVELTSGKTLSIVGIEQPEQVANLLAQPSLSAVPIATGWTPPGGAP